jgi:hypothetical protein
MGFEDWAPGLLGTCGLIMINAVQRSQLTGDASAWSDGEGWRARLWFFLGMLLLMSSIGGAAILFSLKYDASSSAALGVMSLVQTFLLTLSAALLWGVRNSDE